MNGKCSHVEEHLKDIKPQSKRCEDCVKKGDTWLHLRMCMECGYVGCCDSSKNQHARRHFEETGHPLMESLERGDNWRWCYVDEVFL